MIVGLVEITAPNGGFVDDVVVRERGHAFAAVDL